MTDTPSRDAKKKREQRRRAKAGRKIIMVEIMDWGAWCHLLEEDGWLKENRDDDEAVRAATEASIWDECREYRRQRANEEMKLFENRRTGAIEREPTPESKPVIIKKGSGSPPGPPPNPLWNPKGKRYVGRSLTSQEVAAWEEENRGDEGSADSGDDLRDGDDSGFDDAEDFMGEDYAAFEDEKVLEDD